MGNEVAEVVDELPSARTIKVHARMCSDLLVLVTKVSKLLPEIEVARPRCSSGIEALCLLNNGIVKSKALLQHCSESSILYLALTGDALLSRCKKSRSLLELSLSQIQNMVPVILAAKISGIIVDLRSAVFSLDPLEEEAGKILRELLHRYGSTTDSSEEAALAAIHVASSRLHITSQKSLLIEKRCIRKMIDKFGEREQSKRKILLLFLNLLNKYGKSMTKQQTDNSLPQNDHHFPSSSPRYISGEVESRVNHRFDEAKINILSSPVPPEEFICPLSLRLMFDPVVIVSGQTYERTWIQKWFDEGHDTCPKTNIKLSHLSFTSNTGMKDLILRWCTTQGVSVPDIRTQEAIIKSLETSMNSIVSLSSSINDLNLQLDFSNVSVGSSHGSYSDPSYNMISNDVKISREIDSEFFSKFSSLPWDSRRNVVEDFMRLLKHNDQSWTVTQAGKFVQLLVRFLKDACDLHDVEAQMSGCILLLEVLLKHRDSITYMKEDAYNLLASFLDSVVSKQALSVIEVLSFNQQCFYELKASGALTAILNILESQVQDLLEPAVKIWSNLSLNRDFCSIIMPSDLIPKLIPFFEDSTLATHCATILRNMCDNSDGRVSIAKTDGCISSVAKLLENESHEDQEHAVYILLSLCSQCVRYCHLVMYEGVIPGLFSISVNGNKKAKAMAMELLRILKDEVDSSGESSVSESEVVTDSTKQQNDDKIPPKASGLFGRFLAKRSASAAKKKK